MSEQLKSKCPICGGYLFDDDDIVYCPDCGAPHHRDCWNAVGHCGLADDHGTEREYKPEQQAAEEKNICPRCKRELPEDVKFCPYCGMAEKGENGDTDDEEDEFAQINASIPDPLGGVDKAEKLDGVEAETLARFTMFMPNRMLPLFKSFADGNAKHSWNWAAFLSPYTQAFFRKMDFHTVLYLLLEFAAYVMLTPLWYAISGGSQPSTTAILQGALGGDFALTAQTLVFALIGLLLFFGTRVFAGLFNDKLYFNHAVQRVKSIRADMDADDEEQLRKKGGVRPFLAMGLLLVSSYFCTYLPTLLAGLLM